MAGHERKRPTGWDAVAKWYNGWMGEDGSHHHQKVAVPAVIALLQPQPNEHILDIGAGQGVLAPHIAKAGAKYTGVDVSPRLLEYARKNHSKHGRFLQADAANLNKNGFLEAGSFDAVVFLLSIQDMNPLEDVLRSALWALKPRGRAVLFMTHPAFRIPRQSGWGYDEGRKLQYRRVDRYITPLPVPMKSYESQDSGVTISFHRPISEYVNTLAGLGMCIDQMVEIPIGDNSLKPNRTRAEKLADSEIPLFLGLHAKRIS